MIPYWLGMVVLALILWGITGVTQKLSTNNISSRLSLIWFALAFVPIALLLLVSHGLDGKYSVGLVLLAALGGVLNGLGALTAFQAFESGGKASVVVPLMALYPMVTVLLAFIFLNERLSGTQWLGVALALVAGVLLSLETKESQD